jgi:HK97 gp10 family phage protein
MIKWHGKQVLNASKIALGRVSKEVANDVMEDAKNILKIKAKTTTELGLLSQFYVDKSKFVDGGYVVFCQGPKNWLAPYHASFFEMGTFKDEAKPFMRPAYKKNKRNANLKFKKALDKL